MREESLLQKMRRFKKSMDEKTKTYLKIGAGFLAFVILLATIMAASVSAGVALGIVSTLAWGALFLKLRMKYPSVYYRMLDYSTVFDVVVMFLGLMMFGVTISGLFAAAIAGILVSLGLNSLTGIERVVLMDEMQKSKDRRRCFRALVEELNVKPEEVILSRLYEVSIDEYQEDTPDTQEPVSCDFHEVAA